MMGINKFTFFIIPNANPDGNVNGHWYVTKQGINLNRDRTTVGGMKNIFIDMLISSKNKILVGDYQSTFTELTWWYGNCDNKLILIK